MTRVPLLRLVLPLLLCKKNNQVPRKRKRKHDTPKGKRGSVYTIVAKLPAVARQEHAIRKKVREVLRRAGVLAVNVADVELDVTWSVPSQRLVVDVYRATGAPFVCRSHDLVNMLDTLCDGLQGAAFANDAQVRAVHLRKSDLTVDQLRAVPIGAPHEGTRPASKAL